VDETGPDQNYRSVELICIVTTELTFIVYIVIVLQSLVSVQFSCLEKKKKFGSVSESPIINNMITNQVTMLFYVVAKLIRFVLIMAAFQVFILYNIIRLFWRFWRTSTQHPINHVVAIRLVTARCAWVHCDYFLSQFCIATSSLLRLHINIGHNSDHPNMQQTSSQQIKKMAVYLVTMF